VLLKSWVYQ